MSSERKQKTSLKKQQKGKFAENSKEIIVDILGLTKNQIFRTYTHQKKAAVECAEYIITIQERKGAQYSQMKIDIS